MFRQSISLRNLKRKKLMIQLSKSRTNIFTIRGNLFAVKFRYSYGAVEFVVVRWVLLRVNMKLYLRLISNKEWKHNSFVEILNRFSLSVSIPLYVTYRHVPQHQKYYSYIIVAIWENCCYRSLNAVIKFKAIFKTFSDICIVSSLELNWRISMISQRQQ